MLTHQTSMAGRPFLGPIVAMALAFSLLAGSAVACRIGGDDFLHVDITQGPPEGARYASIALVHLEGKNGGPQALLGALDSKRGLIVGTATVLKVERGPVLPATLPVYLAMLTSCSNFGRSSNRISAIGYIVGQLEVDAEGPYFSLRERNDTTGAWR